MLEFLGLNKTDDAISLIKKDHETVKELFTDFEHASSRAEKRAIVAKVIEELKLHAEVEEKLFYARIRPELDKEIMTEADEEHHVAKFLIAELEQMDGSEEHYDAKFNVLAENIRHHIREEEGNMLPKAHGLDLDYVAMGEEMQRQKQKLLKNGFPVSAEEKMVGRRGTSHDSPALTAVRSKTTKATVTKDTSAKATKAKPSPVKTKTTKTTVKGPAKVSATAKLMSKLTGKMTGKANGKTTGKATAKNKTTSAANRNLKAAPAAKRKVASKR